MLIEEFVDHSGQQCMDLWTALGQNDELRGFLKQAWEMEPPFTTVRSLRRTWIECGLDLTRNKNWKTGIRGEIGFIGGPGQASYHWPELNN
jgi:hypothetical protein